MNCDQAQVLLHAYLDDELEMVSILEVEAHLRDCAKCRQTAEAVKQLRAAIAKPGIYSSASSALRNHLSQAIRSETAADSKIRHAVPNQWKMRMVFSGLAAAIVLIVGSVLLFSQAHHSRVEIAELLDSHLRSLEANHLVDVESTDQHTVKPWFTGKLDFSPPTIDLSGEGFPLVGGRMDYLQQHQVAALVYRRNKHVINLFIWPGKAAFETDARQGFNLISFNCDGMACWAVSDLNAAELQQFTELFHRQKPASTRY